MDFYLDLFLNQQDYWASPPDWAALEADEKYNEWTPGLQMEIEADTETEETK